LAGEARVHSVRRPILLLAPDRRKLRGAMTEDEALGALRGSDAGAAARAEALLWEMWHRSGDRELDALLREGIATMERRDLAEAGARPGEVRLQPRSCARQAGAGLGPRRPRCGYNRGRARRRPSRGWGPAGRGAATTGGATE